MITRTTFTTTYKAVKVNLEKRTFDDVEETIFGNYNNEDSIDKLKKALEKNGDIIASLDIISIDSELREMTDEEWIEHSRPVQKKQEYSGRGRKPKKDK